MRYDIEFKGSYSLLKVQLNAGEELTVEPGAMVYMRGPIEVETSTGGIWKALKRSFLGGESFFHEQVHITRRERNCNCTGITR